MGAGLSARDRDAPERASVALERRSWSTAAVVAARANWYPSDTDPTHVYPPPSGDGDDDPTIVWTGRDTSGDDDPTIARTDALLDHRYQLIRPIGKGGMGEVWEARHVQLAHAVAIKFLTHEAGGPRFKREAQAIVSLRHSGVVDVLDFGETEQGVPYFVMELIVGETLADRVHRQGPLSWALVRNVALEVSDALAHAHAAGVIHRDLKPSNVLVLDAPPPRGSSTKLIDFGIAKLLDADLPRLTRTGHIQGTPAYMSPEQVLGEPVDARADVYGLGCLLYYLLSGRKPFAGKAGTAALRAQIYELPPSFIEAAPDVGIPAVVEAVVRRAMAKDKHARFESMNAMQAAILAIPPDASASMSNLPPKPDPLPEQPANAGSLADTPAIALQRKRASPKPSFAKALAAAVVITAALLVVAALVARMIWT
jgi:eukaryotic-like serine/threonine-protein kinase